MNTVNLLGHLVAPPTYFCTREGQDVTRLIVRTEGGGGAGDQRQSHHCVAWGPAALQLHQHLSAGDRLMVRGELRYRRHTDASGQSRLRTEIYIQGFTFLDRGRGADLPPQIRSSRMSSVS